MTRPQRVRVTHPRTGATRRAPVRPAVREIDEQTQLGEVYMASLIRSQRRLALGVVVLVGVLLVGTALLGAAAQRFDRLRLLGIPLPWLLLGVLVYPLLIGLGWYTVRHAERNERAFHELIRRR
jgi:predicted membrane channel-forming protein YqfA (hemolysin III family)